MGINTDTQEGKQEGEKQLHAVSDPAGSRQDGQMDRQAGRWNAQFKKGQKYEGLLWQERVIVLEKESKKLGEPHEKVG